ncbi:MAG: octanoyltransferase [Candidatus Muproteobacteria bacterium RBG_16_65_31]|uniref:Octanoyltransferase n=1 Tax=Candidatus Muproteobacteria bacterium RBG_16_65_31 TaxID=1817759 RepID=A0A1F6TES8_9PROT|nr:MAG: octanoyltransferase [Candidatus Muproteobacteria bacterium RBG_16_65_31]
MIVRKLGCIAYDAAWRAMRAFTAARTDSTPDEIWLLEHPPVYTMGLRGRDGTARALHGVPLVYTDRGGDMTYHGPGQLIAYVLMDLRRRNWGVRTLVRALEQAVLDLLAAHGVGAARRAGAPGVYVEGKKIAALGLRVRQGRSYHGLALNVSMDLAPFNHIDPCGYPGLAVTQLADLGLAADMQQAEHRLRARLVDALGYNAAQKPHDDEVIRAALHG